MNDISGYFETEQVTARCSMCDNEFDTTRKQAANPCPLCQGELQIEHSEYAQIREDLAKLARQIASIENGQHREGLQLWFEKQAFYNKNLK